MNDFGRKNDALPYLLVLALYNERSQMVHQTYI